eukprot:Clim_evm1s157 gene=Clim_evmTU1s157
MASADVIQAARSTVVPNERRTYISAQHPTPTQPATDNDRPRMELYSSAFSICSNKVRMTLAAKGVDYISHEVDIKYPAQENFKPEYVKLRLESSIAQNSDLMAVGFTGGSAVAEDGFDALVVPTLVDNEKAAVVADSRLICLYICDNISGGQDLMPDRLRDKIMEQLDIVDGFPHVAMLYGANPDSKHGDRRPDLFKTAMIGVHDKKAEAVETAWQAVKGQSSRLDAAYSAKLEKQKSCHMFTATKEKMQNAVDKAQQLVEALGKLLVGNQGPWIFGEDFTLADVFWIVSIFRLQYLGYGWLWEERSDLAHISEYAKRGYALESMKSAVLMWPGTPPSPWVKGLLPDMPPRQS